jgi:O-antigen/teichoic acid export membrane protein
MSKSLLKSDLGKSISSGYALFLMNNVVALFLTPYMLQFISKEEYGFYVLCVDFLAWIGFLEFGTSKVLESKAGHLIARSETSKLRTSFNSAFYFQLVIAVLIIPVYYFLVHAGISSKSVPHLNVILILFSLAAGLSVFRNLFSAVIIASKKIHLDNRIQLMMNVLNYALVLSLTPFIGVIGLAIINLLVVILILIRSNYRLKQLFPDFHIAREHFDKQELKALFGQGIYFSIGSIATLVLVKMDSFVIAREFSLKQVASFYITIKLFALFQKVVQLFINNFRPHVAQLYGKSDFKHIQFVYEFVGRISISISAVGIAVILFINHVFIHYWVGDSFYLGEAFSIFYGCWIFLDLVTIPARTVLSAALFQLNYQSAFRVLEGGGRIVALILLIPIIGLNSLPLSSMLATFLFGILFFTFQMNRFLNQRAFTTGILPLFISFLVTASAISLFVTDQLFFFPFLISAIGFVLIGTLLFQFKSKLKQLNSFIH